MSACARAWACLWTVGVVVGLELPFPPLSGPLATAYATNLPDTVLDVLFEDGHKLGKYDESSHLHGKRTTYFWKLGTPARFSIEQFAAGVAAKLDFPDGMPGNVVGAEYWVQIRPAHEEINFHYDKDEGWASNKFEMRFPTMGTVTYFSNVGAPTLVLNQTTNHNGNEEVPTIPTEFVLSYPERGKHLTFHGKAQHGVHKQLAQVTGTRFTLLINWWDHVPLEPNCVRLSDSAIASLGMRTLPAPLLDGKWNPSMAAPMPLTQFPSETLADPSMLTRLDIMLAPYDRLSYLIPKTIDISSSSMIGFQIPPEHTTFLSVLNTEKTTQHSHILRTSKLVLFIFCSNDQLPSIEDMLRPIVWELYDGGLIAHGIEPIFVDPVLGAAAYEFFQVTSKDFPKLVMHSSRTGKRWDMKKGDTLDASSARRFVEACLKDAGIVAHDEL